MIFHDVIQNTEEWYQLRSGKATTSKFGLIMAHNGKYESDGSPVFGKPAKEYAQKIALEQLKGAPLEENSFSNKWMDQGHENEPIAKDKYEIKRNNEFILIENGGFCQHEKYVWVGGSPDGLIRTENGGVEVKSVGRIAQRERLINGSYDNSYTWQLVGNMWLCVLDYIDFISYCPSYPPITELYTYRLDRRFFLDKISEIEPRLLQFNKLIEKEKNIALKLVA